MQLREGEVGALAVTGESHPGKGKSCRGADSGPGKLTPSPARCPGWVDGICISQGNPVLRFKMQNKVKHIPPIFSIISMDNTNIILGWHKSA